MKQWKPSTPLRVVKNTIQTIQLKPRDAHFGVFFRCADIFKLIFLLFIYYLNIFPRNCREPQVSPIVELTLCYDSVIQCVSKRAHSPANINVLLHVLIFKVSSYRCVV